MKRVKTKKGGIRLQVILFSFLIISLALQGCKKDEVTPDPQITLPEDTTKADEHKIIILMYHDISPGAPSDIYQRSTADFENDLIYIKSKNYEVICIDDLMKLKDETKHLSSDAVIISFDDGYRSNYSIACPLLKAYDFPATFFVVTEWVGQTDRITWNNAWEMDQYRNTEGRKLFSIESHSSSHPFLKTDEGTFASPAAYQTSLNAEIGDSKSWIESVTGQTSMWLALPYGDGANDSLIISTAKNYHYSGIRTSIYGAFTIKTMDPFVLPSLPILSTTSITDIENYFR